jgi:hypothetical protein
MDETAHTGFRDQGEPGRAGFPGQDGHPQSVGEQSGAEFGALLTLIDPPAGRGKTMPTG